MSLYNLLHGVNANSDILLKMLNLTKNDVGRFRDAYVSENDTICIYTRNGGGNREAYQEILDELSNHQNYITDYDDDFDCTYATIEFSVPDKHKKEIDKMPKEMSGEDKWQELFNRLKGE
jgi:hypothetical protein